MFMPIEFSSSEFFCGTAGVTITMTTPTDQESDPQSKTSSRLRLVLPTNSEGKTGNIEEKKSCGFHLTRSKWDPYPWVGFVEPGSIAQTAGLRPGDCLLEVCGRDVVGLRVKEIAAMIQNRQRQTDLQVWRNHETLYHTEDVDESQDIANDRGIALDGPLPEVARKLASAVSGTVRALECPVCLESAASPVSQCVHGHILCAGCRNRTDRCPVCRVRLGQGRCLLADKVHGTLREAFDLVNGEVHLGEKLFGKSRRNGGGEPINGEGRRGTRNSNRNNGTGPRNLLARLFLGVGQSVEKLSEKAVSAENLSVIVSEGEIQGQNSGRLLTKRLGELSSSDRTKSASTGELASPMTIHSLGTTTTEFPRDNSNSNPDVTLERGLRSTGSLLSVPQTPTWGTSTESISNTFLRCPLASTTNCRELVTPGFILEHLGTAHQGPQVHFYGGTATIPVPTPLGPDAVYVLHHVGELFFFKCDEEVAWMVSTIGSNRWDWYLQGWGTDGTEVKLRRSVASLEDSASLLTTQQIAPLPKALGIRTIEIQLTESRIGEVARM